MDKLSEVSKHEAYNKALKHPQLKCSDSKDLIFDHKFCQHFKHLEHVVINFLTKRKENSSSNDIDSGGHTDPAVVMQYKDLIREQDVRINDLSRYLLLTKVVYLRRRRNLQNHPFIYLGPVLKLFILFSQPMFFLFRFRCVKSGILSKSK